MSEQPKQWGGKRPGAGRPKGSVSEETKQRKAYETKVKALAMAYSVESVEGIWEIASDPEVDPRIRLNAYQQIMDRGLGRPKQQVDHEHTGQVDVVAKIHEIAAELDYELD